MKPHQQQQRVMLLLLSILLATAGQCQSWNFFSSSSGAARDEEKSSKSHYQGRRPGGGGHVVEFSIEGLKDDETAMELVAKAERKIIGSTDSCWSNAYRSQEDAGTPLPPCDAKTPMMKCRQKLNSVESARFAGYFWFFMLSRVQLFKQETQRLVNDLQETARYANDKLQSIEERSEYLLQNSKDILESVSSVELRTKHLEETSKNVESHIDVVLKHSELVYEQSKGIAAAQADHERRDVCENGEVTKQGG